MHYEFKYGFRPRAVKADVVASELERVKEAHGELKAEHVFEDARPKEAPLHGEFEWDGKKAIRELGLIRARTLIRSVVIVDAEPNKQPSRVWVNIRDERKPNEAGTYEKIEVVVKQPDLWEHALTNLNRRYEAAHEAMMEVKRAGEQSEDADRLAKIALVVEGFSTVREALALLK